MTKNEFEEDLQRLIGRARRFDTIPLHELINVLGAELAGLEMAHDEGEEF